MFAEELKKQRERCGFTQEEVENLLALKKGTVNKWETGKKEPNLNTLVLISNLFLCTTDTLLGKKKFNCRGEDLYGTSNK